ncbi:hypothetical protein CYLTODRAFT_477892 [Cylindrobasidium torrendii FP15055 ss-10]|uniref:Zinc-finger domain-containing protein n=1 Tax=Cylindrobasidium torrendii FP15055 ss-10 TaxID=1314674 RepID=A0A0D7AU38_9AGAR|nr:hypothetical protein CYLTODRAFT_477892 [Cylindrobasidium torrendii FP15055 ss-10]
MLAQWGRPEAGARDPRMDIPGPGRIGKHGVVNQKHTQRQKRARRAQIWFPKKNTVSVGVTSPSASLLEPQLSSGYQGTSSSMSPSTRPAARGETASGSPKMVSFTTNEGRGLGESPSRRFPEVEDKVSMISTDVPSTSPSPTSINAKWSPFRFTSSPLSSQQHHPHIATKEPSNDYSGSTASNSTGGNDAEGSNREVEFEDSIGIVLESAQTGTSPVHHTNSTRVPRRVSEVSVRTLEAVFPNGIEYHRMDLHRQRSSPFHLDPSTWSPQARDGTRAPTPGAAAQGPEQDDAVSSGNDVEDLKNSNKATPLSASPFVAGSASSSTPSSCVLPTTAPTVTSSDLLSMEQFQLPSWPKSSKSDTFTAALTECLSPSGHTVSKKRLRRERCERDGSVPFFDLTQDEEDNEQAPRCGKQGKPTEDSFKEGMSPINVAHLTIEDQPKASRQRKVVQNDSIDTERLRSTKRKGREQARGALQAVGAEDPSLLRKRRRLLPVNAQRTSSSFADSLASAYNQITENADDADIPTPPATTALLPTPSSRKPTSNFLAKPPNDPTSRIVADSPPPTSSTLPAHGRMAKKPSDLCASKDEDAKSPGPILQKGSKSPRKGVFINAVGKSAGPSTAPSWPPPHQTTTLKTRTLSAKSKPDWPLSSEERLNCHPCRKSTPLIATQCSACSKVYCIRCLKTRFESLPPRVSVPTTTNVSTRTCPFCEGFCTCPTCQRKRASLENLPPLQSTNANTSVPVSVNRRECKLATTVSARSQSKPNEATDTGDAIPRGSSLLTFPCPRIDTVPPLLLSATGRPLRKAAARPVYTEHVSDDEDWDVEPDPPSVSVPRAGKGVHVNRKYNTEDVEDVDEDSDVDQEVLLDPEESDVQEQSDEDELYPVLDLNHIQIPMTDMEELGVGECGLSIGPLYHPVTTLRMGTGMLVVSQVDECEGKDAGDAEIGIEDDGWGIDSWEMKRPKVFCVGLDGVSADLWVRPKMVKR